MKRMIAFLLAMVMLLSSIPTVVFAAEEQVTEPTTEVVEEVVTATEAAALIETIAPTLPAVPEETSAPAEETVAPTETIEETVAPTEEEPVDETAAPTELPVQEEAVAPVLTWHQLVCSEDNKWALEDWDGTNGGLYGHDRLEVSSGEYWLAFYLNVWNAETDTWDYQPVHVDFSGCLSGELLEDGNYEFASDAEDSAFYYHVTVTEAENDETVAITCVYEGAKLAVNVEISFDSATEVSGEVIITEEGAVNDQAFFTASKVTTSQELVTRLLNIANNYKTLYVMGGQGGALTSDNKAKYISEYAYYNAKPDRKQMINAASSDTFAFDCCGVIKAVLWGWDGTQGPYRGGAQWGSNGVKDSGTDVMITECKEVSTDFNHIEPGELLWMSGHVGIYIGDGKAVECTPGWKNCVQITDVQNIKKTGVGHTWTKHGKLPTLQYCQHLDGFKDNGICKTCGTQVIGTLNEEKAGVYTVVKGFHPRKNSPYSAEPEDESRYFAKGDKVTVFGLINNAYENDWYKIGYGDGKIGYIYHDFLKKSGDALVVKYDANGGSGAPGNQTKVYGSTLTLSTKKPTRSGYTFLGWSTSSTATSATYAAGGKYTSNASVTLYAVWKEHICDKGTFKWKWDAHPHYSCYACSICGEVKAARDEPNYSSSCETCTQSNSYTITLDPQGGFCSLPSVTVVGGKAIGTLPVATRSGYIFEGWYTSSGTKVTTSSTFSSNTTIYAYWNTNYTDIGDDFYAYLGHKASGHGVSNVGSNVELGTANADASIWRFIRQSDGSYKILSFVDSKALDVYDNGTDNYTNVWVYQDNSTLAQRWFVRAVNGGYILIAANSGKALDVYNGDTAIGTNVDIYSINSTAAQTMTITKISNPTISSSAASITLKVGESQTISVTKSGYYAGTYHFNYQLSNNNVSAVWGDWEGTTCPLTITAVNPGTTEMTLNLRDFDTKETLDSIIVKITVETDNSVIFFDPCNGGAVTTLEVPCGSAIIVPYEIPYKQGYTFLGWSWAPDGPVWVEPGDSLWVSEDECWLYAIYQDPVEIQPFTSLYSGCAEPQYDGANYWYSFTPSVTTSYYFRGFAPAESSIAGVLIMDSQGEVLVSTSSSAGYPFITTCDLIAGNTYYISFVSIGGIGKIPFEINHGYSVTYDVGRGTNCPQPTYSYYDIVVSITSLIPTRVGHRFLGWSTDEDATSPDYHPGDEVIFYSDVTLYAVWEKTNDIVYGDVNYDNNISTSDLTILRKYVELGTLPAYFDEPDFGIRADLDKNGVIDSTDYEMCRSMVVGNISQEDIHSAYEGTFIWACPKTTYALGEALDTTGLEIFIAYNYNASYVTYEASYVISEDLVVSGFDPGKTGRQTLTVTYHQFTTTYDVTVEAHQHMYSTTVTKPTCTENGFTAYTCKCGYSYIDNWVEATGHSETTVPGKAATCTESGLSDGKKCSVCGTVTLEQKSISATGHSLATVPGTPATCTQSGLTDGKKCAVCNAVIVAQITIPSKGHTEETIAGTPATCTETGLTDGKKCSVCRIVIVEQQVIDPLYHNEEIVVGMPASCTTDGLTEGKRCSICGEELTGQKVIPALGHIEVIDKAIASTCTATGLTEGKHCSVCNEVLVAQETVDALGHEEVIDEAIAPTCTETGLTEGKHCDRCGEIYVAQEVIPALGHEFAVQNGEIVCAVCGETVTIHIHQDYVALDIYENPQVQLYVDIAPANLTADLSWSAEGNDGILQFDQNGLITALRAGTAYVVAEITVDGFTISSRCRVDVTEDVQILGIQLSTDKVTTELYKDEFATFEILLDLPQNRPFEGDELIVSDDAAMAVNGMKKSNIIESVQFKNISDLFELVLLDDRTVQIVPTAEAMKPGKKIQGSYTDTVIVKIRGEDEPRKEELKLTLSVKKNLPKPKAKINAFNSFYEGQSQEIVITGVDVTGIRANENVATPIPNWLTLEDGKLTLNGNTPKSSDKAYLWVDVDGFRYPVELTLTVKHSKKAPTLKFAKSSVTLNKAAEQQIEVAVTSSDAAYIIEDPDIRITGGKTGELEAFYDNGMLIVTTTAKTPDKGTYKVYIKTPGCKEVATTVKVVNTEPSVSYKAATLDLNFPEQVVAVVPTFKNYSGDFKIESMHAQNAKKLYVDFFQVTKDGKNILVTCDEDTPTGSYNLDVELKLDDGQTINGTAKVSVKRTAVKLKLSSTKVSLNKELPDQAVVEVSCTTKNYKFDLNDAVLTYDDKMLDIVTAGNALIIKLKDGAEYGKTYPVSVSADYQGAPAVKLNVAVLKKGSVVKSTIKATGTLDVIREGTAITIKPTYTNYLNVNVDEDAVLKIYSSKDNYQTAIAELHSENGFFTIDSSVISNHVLKYKAQLETVIGGETITSNQISLSVKMGAAKLTTGSSGTTMFAKDRNDRAVVWFESSDATLNDVASIQIKDAKYKDAFEIIDYRDGSFAICFKDGKIHESIAKQLEKKSSVSITLNLNVFIEGNATVDPAISKTAKANATQKVKLTIVK